MSWKCWWVPNPPVVNPTIAERAPWGSTKHGVAEEQSIRNVYRFLSFPMHLRHPHQPPVLTRTEGSFSCQGVSKRGLGTRKKWKGYFLFSGGLCHRNWQPCRFPGIPTIETAYSCKSTNPHWWFLEAFFFPSGKLLKTKNLQRAPDPAKEYKFGCVCSCMALPSPSVRV